ncbi:MAG TPA: thymidine phosphorylase [Clostridiales bacterium]|nr:thymidine phosphorylase [Clostridiales bacterium]
MRMYNIIEKKRDGCELSYEEISFFIDGVIKENIPDYQTAALLMAIFIRGINPRETADLTRLMVDSGDKIDLSSIKGIKVDKHSTGGVGDKTTLIAAPVVAACGIPVIKMSGRGLGHTGGTIDKLQSIPGFKTDIDKEEIIKNVKRIGISIAGQSNNLVPADKKLYALRDVTATVDSIPLIAASIMSKKIASGTDKIVLDVKAGSGAFMKDIDHAISLGKTMVEIGERTSRETVVIVTDMDIPLGNAIGNSLEVIEAIEVLKGRGPSDLKTISLEIAAHMLKLAGMGNMEECRVKARNAIDSRKAMEKFKELVKAQYGIDDVIEDYSIFKQPLYKYDIAADMEGFIESMDTRLIGQVSSILGAGRQTKESLIDYSAGVYIYKKTGMEVKKGEIIATLYTDKSEIADEAVSLLKGAFNYSRNTPQLRPLILAYVDSKHTFRYAD